MGGDSVHVNAAGSPPPPERVSTNQCPRCGKVAAAAGHPTLGEWEECVEAFRLRGQLTKWADEWCVPAGQSTAER